MKLRILWTQKPPTRFVIETSQLITLAVCCGYVSNLIGRRTINIPEIILGVHGFMGFTVKCHWDQNFGIPYFCIFENSLWLLVAMPNFNSLRRLEVAFFGRFLSRFYGRHYWPLFRKLACELAEVTFEAHLKSNTFIRLLAARNLTVVDGSSFLPTVCCTALKFSLLQQL